MPAVPRRYTRRDGSTHQSPKGGCWVGGFYYPYRWYLPPGTKTYFIAWTLTPDTWLVHYRPGDIYDGAWIRFRRTTLLGRRPGVYWVPLDNSEGKPGKPFETDGANEEGESKIYQIEYEVGTRPYERYNKLVALVSEVVDKTQYTYFVEPKSTVKGDILSVLKITNPALYDKLNNP